MNAIVAERLDFNFNPDLPQERLRAQFRAGKRVHVENFLVPAAAEALSRHLMEGTPYQTYVTADLEEMATAPGPESVLGPNEEKEIFEIACEGARNGFASYFEANRSLLNAVEMQDFDFGTHAACTEFLYSPEFLSLIERISGLEGLSRIDWQATRFRSGHFVTFNSGTDSADQSGKRRLNFELNLTRQWRPEWGGMLEMRGDEGHQIEAVMPCFNSLDLFTFPRGYWISQVTPFALATRYAISGSIYAD